MERWSELRTAYQVATRGTVSAAAEALGLHRATVIRHVDALEAALGATLFHRHARGYTPTEAGEDMLRVGRITDEQLDALARRIRGRRDAVSGELIVTSVEVVAPTLIEACRRFRDRHPEATARYVVSGRLFALEYGEAHVAVRSGPRPVEPDNVVQPFFTLRNGLYGHVDYLTARGRPNRPEDLASHDLIGPEDPDSPLPWFRWLRDHVPAERIVFRSANQRILFRAVAAGVALGFMPESEASRYPDVEAVIPPRPAWDIDFWLLTHVDLHRSAKVQAFLEVLQPLLAEAW